MKTITTLFTQKKELILALSCGAILFILPALVVNQAVVGPIVNATLLLSLFYLGKSQAFFLAMLPSTVALANGLLPVALAPMLPFIMLSNVIYLQTFAVAEKKVAPALAVFCAAGLKTLFLTLIVHLLMDQFLALPLLARVQTMMTWPQWWTATVGGLLALGVRAHVKI